MSDRGGGDEELVGRWTLVGGLPTFARVSATPLPATAPAVVLVHGLVVSSRYMLPTARRLARYCRVCLPDLPGYGHSAKPPRVLDVPALADALDEWMQAV